MRRYASPACRSSLKSHSQAFQFRQRGFSATTIRRSQTHRSLQQSHRLFTNVPEHGSSIGNDVVLEAFKKTLTKSIDDAVTDYNQLKATEIPELVKLVGYLGKWNNLSKNLSFASLSNPSQDQVIQLVSSVLPDQPETAQAHSAYKSVRPNSAVHVAGYLRSKQRPSKDAGQHGIGQLEISVCGLESGIEILNEFPPDVILKPETQFSARQRNLQLRNSPDVRQTLRTRAEMQQHCRTILQQRGSMSEIDTPLLFKSTSEGAREFIVPTRRKGYAYALPQSPQQFKQILMSSGIAGYFQFAKCFRDEDLREDRQPEFTQLDLELSFASSRKVMLLIEEVIRSLWQKFLAIDLPAQFARKTYQEAMAQYGSDKPDLRIPVAPFVKIGHAIPVDLTRMMTSIENPIVEVMVMPLTCTPKETKKFVASFFATPEGRDFQANIDGAPGIFIYDSTKPLQGLSAFGFEAAEALERDLQLEDGNLIILQARQNVPFAGGSTTLGRLRSAIFRASVAAGHIPSPQWTDFKALWIIDFPLFSPTTLDDPGQGGNAGISSTHHPFTSPKTPEDVELLKSEPLKVTGDHFDLVINGEEVGGGSRRIHHAAMQDLIFRDVLKMEEDRIYQFCHLLEALRAGCPPHSGFAIGFDRLVAMMMSCKLEKSVSMRNVIAFPKIGNGSDPMVQSPGPLTDDVLGTFHLSITK